MEYRLINQPDKEKSVIEQVLYNRGITDIKHYLFTTDDDILNPSLLDNIDVLIQKLFLAAKEKKHATICIDCD